MHTNLKIASTVLGPLGALYITSLVTSYNSLSVPENLFSKSMGAYSTTGFVFDFLRPSKVFGALSIESDPMILLILSLTFLILHGEQR